MWTDFVAEYFSKRRSQDFSLWQVRDFDPRALAVASRLCDTKAAITRLTHQRGEDPTPLGELFESRECE